jgi:twitching motility protein PilI
MAENESETVLAAFETLRDFERRSLIHAVGLPEQNLGKGAWSGIAFKLAEANLVSEIRDVVEILTYPPLTRIPGSQAWVLGIANIRGNLVPIIDLKGYLGGERSIINKSSRVLVVRQQDGGVGLLIDEIQGQRHFVDEELSDDGHFESHMASPFVSREYFKNDVHWGAFDAVKLINNSDFMKAAA